MAQIRTTTVNYRKMNYMRVTFCLRGQNFQHLNLCCQRNDGRPDVVLSKLRYRVVDVSWISCR